MQAILSSMIEGVLAVDSEGRIVSINKAAADLLGIDVSEPLGLSIEVAVRNTELQRYIKNILEAGESAETESFVFNEGGRILQLYGSGWQMAKVIIAVLCWYFMILHELVSWRK